MTEKPVALPSPQRCNEIAFPGPNEQVCVAAADHEGEHNFWPREIAGTNSATSADYVRAMEAQGIKPINFTPDDMEPRLHAKPGSYLRAKGKPGVALPSSPACNCGAGDKMSANFHYTYCPLSKGVPSSPAPDDFRAKIQRLLRSYRCQHTQDDGSGCPLVDLLTPEGDTDISRGWDEIFLLADYLAAELGESVPSTPWPTRGAYDVAADIIDLFLEYRDKHLKPEIEAKHCAATEYEESEDLTA